MHRVVQHLVSKSTRSSTSLFRQSFRQTSLLSSKTNRSYSQETYSSSKLTISSPELDNTKNNEPPLLHNKKKSSKSYKTAFAWLLFPLLTGLGILFFWIEEEDDFSSLQAFWNNVFLGYYKVKGYLLQEIQNSPMISLEQDIRALLSSSINDELLEMKNKESHLSQVNIELEKSAMELMFVNSNEDVLNTLQFFESRNLYDFEKCFCKGAYLMYAQPLNANGDNSALKEFNRAVEILDKLISEDEQKIEAILSAPKTSSSELKEKIELETKRLKKLREGHRTVRNACLLRKYYIENNIEEVSKMIEKYPNLSFAYLYRGKLQTDAKLALQDFETANQLHESFLAYYFIAQTQLRDYRDYENARKNISKAIILEPELGILYLLRSDCWDKDDLVLYNQFVLSDANKALEIQKGLVSAYFERARSYEDSQIQLDIWYRSKVRENVAKGVETPKYEQISYMVERHQLLILAHRDFSTFISKSSHGLPTQSFYLAHLLRAEVDYELNHFHRALRDYHFVVHNIDRLDLKDQIKCYIGRGKVYKALGHYHKALEDLKKAQKLSPNDEAVIQSINKLRKKLRSNLTYPTLEETKQQ